MIVKILYFILGILVPYFVEQYSYSKFIPNKNSQTAQMILQGYGWRFIWDTAYFFALISAAYRIIFQSAPLSTWEWLGYFCFLFGVILRVWALKELGKFYDSGIALQANHQIIQTGPYRVLRHPLHIGTLAQITGLASLAPIWLSIPAILASLALCLYLNRTEDKIHAQQLSPDFQSYYSRTWDLVDLIFWKSR